MVKLRIVLCIVRPCCTNFLILLIGTFDKAFCVKYSDISTIQVSTYKSICHNRKVLVGELWNWKRYESPPAKKWLDDKPMREKFSHVCLDSDFFVSAAYYFTLNAFMCLCLVILLPSYLLASILFLVYVFLLEIASSRVIYLILRILRYNFIDCMVEGVKRSSNLWFRHFLPQYV